MKRIYSAVMLLEAVYAVAGVAAAIAPAGAVLALSACATSPGGRQETRQEARTEGRTKERQEDRRS